jgi:hypothetical protein
MFAGIICIRNSDAVFYKLALYGRKDGDLIHELKFVLLMQCISFRNLKLITMSKELIWKLKIL